MSTTNRSTTRETHLLSEIVDALRVDDLGPMVVDGHTIRLEVESSGDSSGPSHRDAIAFRIDATSQYLRLSAPDMWVLPDDDRRSAVIETVMRLQSLHPTARFVLGAGGRTIGVEVEFATDIVPEASTVTGLVRGIATLIVNAEPVVRTAINDGTVWSTDPAGTVMADETLSRLDLSTLNRLVDAASMLSEHPTLAVDRLTSLTPDQLGLLLDALDDETDT